MKVRTLLCDNDDSFALERRPRYGQAGSTVTCTRSPCVTSFPLKGRPAKGRRYVERERVLGERSKASRLRRVNQPPQNVTTDG